MFHVGVAVEDSRLERELAEIRRLVVKLGEKTIAPAAVNFRDAAVMLGCSPNHVTKLVRNGLLSPRDILGARRIPVSQIYALLEQPTPKSSGAAPERVKFDADAAKRRLAELRAKRPRR